MSNYEATKYDFDGANLTGIEGIPTATIVPWSDSSVPSGFLECNGQAVSRSTYAALFAIVATTYGAGDGSTTFNVPDLQNNVPVGKSNNKALASTGGSDTVTSTGNIAGSTANATLAINQAGSHNHNVPLTSLTTGGNTIAGGMQGGANANDASGSKGGSGGHAHNLSANFVGGATSVLQPYLTILYLIKT
jgi:microcystin-dependent protein